MNKNSIPEPNNPLTGGDTTDTISKVISVVHFINHATEADYKIEEGAATGLHYISAMIKDALKFELDRMEAQS